VKRGDQPMTGTYNQLDNLSPEERALALEMLK